MTPHKPIRPLRYLIITCLSDHTQHTHELHDIYKLNVSDLLAENVDFQVLSHVWPEDIMKIINNDIIKTVKQCNRLMPKPCYDFIKKRKGLVCNWVIEAGGIIND